MRAVAGVLVTSVLLLGGQQLPASARADLPTPTGLTPDGVAVDAIPVLSWDRTTGATGYNVELSTSPTFTSAFWTSNTSNHQAVPTKQLPTQTVYWRVRATSSSQGASPWAVATLDRNTLAGPTQITPEDGTVLRQPFEPALTTWTPVSGAKDYTLEWSTDSTFADTALKKSVTTKTTSAVVPFPQIAQAYYWRVRATLDSGIYTQWSSVRSYNVGGLHKPVLTSPADGPDSNVEDIALDWQPVMGAKSYNLQVSTDQNFAATNLDVNVSNIEGTRYSPPITLANDQYYWRVQPVDGQGNKLDWSVVDVWTFRRHWPDQPSLEYPADDAVVADPPYFQWTPVHLAAAYRVDISSSLAFPATASTKSYTTFNTTWVPTGAWLPAGASGGSYYWRVVAIDTPGITSSRDPIVTDQIAAQVRHFVYSPDSVVLGGPADGATVDVPTLSWEPVAGAQSYQVTITALADGQNGGVFTTNSTSFTPRSQLTPGASYRWDVQPKSSAGVLGSARLAGAQPTFTMSTTTPTTGATPEPTNSPGPSVRFPTLTWTPVTDATRYRILVRPSSGVGWTYLADRFVYPAGEDDTLDFVTPGTWQWMVEAYNVNTLISTSSSPGTFEIAELSAMSGLHAALTGTASDTPATSCATVLPERCMDLRQTPVLSWNPVSAAAGYTVYLARDEQMTNLVIPPKYTQYNKYIDVDTLVDSQAGSAFYWQVVPCFENGNCAALTHATHAFNKLSKPIETISPAEGDTVANEVTFTWRDYLETNQDPSAFPSNEPTGISDIDPRQEAKRYRIQVSADANFQTTLDDEVVDQTTFTSFANTYPEGPLYWRVQALDGSDNPLAWSAPVGFTKHSPTVTLTEPINGAQVSGSVPLRWDPVAYAASYDVEVYRNNDTTGSVVNRVDSGNTLQTAVSWLDPMEVDSSFYTWRVRPVDAEGRKGRWTDLADPAAKFKVVGDTPVLFDPADGVWVSGNNALFTWEGVGGATSYRFERRPVSGSASPETITTPALAWAPRSQIADGQWQWRVSALDAAGKVLGASDWRGFRVDDTAPTIKSYGPRPTMSKSANLVVVFSEPVSVSSKQFRIRVLGTSTNLLGTVTLNATKTKATLNPTANLKVGKTYTVSLSSGIRDSNGNHLLPFSWTVKVV